MKRIITLAVFLFLVFSVALAKLDYFGIDTQILDESHASIKFTIYKAKEFSFRFYGVIRNLTSNVDCFYEGELITCQATNETSINVQIVSDVISKAGNIYSFDLMLDLNEDVGRVTSILTLPIGTILTNETSSIFPANYRTLSNGRNILVYWEMENVSSLQPLKFKVKYQSIASPEVFNKLYLTVLILLAITILAIIYALKKRKVIVKKIVKIKPEKVVMEVLDPYERKIYEIVRERKTVKQNELVNLTGFSKARVSRVVNKLKERNLVIVEKRGKTNLIRIKEK